MKAASHVKMTKSRATMQPKATFHFPKDFLWGAAYPAHPHPSQTSNNYRVNWAKNSPLHAAPPIKTRSTWKADFEKAKALGLNALILTLDWSRVQPTPQRWNEQAIDHYRTKLTNLLDKNIQPFVLLQHFREPDWFFEAGSWGNKAAIQYYQNYVEKMATALGELCQYWITFFEPNQYLFNTFLLQKYPQPAAKALLTAWNATKNILHAHQQAYQVIHRLQADAQVTIGTNFRQYAPARDKKILERIAIPVLNGFYNHFIHRGLTFIAREPARLFVKHPPAFDFMLVRYDGDQEIIGGIKKPLQIQDSGTAYGLKKVFTWVKSFQKPFYLLGTNPTPQNPAYLLTNLHSLWKTANLNPYLQGYFYHPGIDGFTGAYASEKQSEAWMNHALTPPFSGGNPMEIYRKIVQNNAISFDLVHQTSPQLVQQLFP